MTKAQVVESWTEIDDTSLTNPKRGATAPPDGKPWEYIIFAWDVEVRQLAKRQKEFAKRRMIELSDPTEDGIIEQLRALATASKVIPERGRDQQGNRTDAYRVIELPEENR